MKNFWLRIALACLFLLVFPSLLGVTADPDDRVPVGGFAAGAPAQPEPAPPEPAQPGPAQSEPEDPRPKGEQGLWLRLRTGTGEAVACEPLPEGPTVLTHEYVHSADRTPIRLFFRVDREKGLVFLYSAYRWYGGGLEYRAELIEGHHKGWTIVRGGQPFEEWRIEFRVAWTVDQWIRWLPTAESAGAALIDLFDEHEGLGRWRFQDLAPGGALLVLTLETLPCGE